MASVFTKIINGELPGRFVWKDERCVAFLTVAPLKPGHTLVVPREEVDHWQELAPDLLVHLTRVSQSIGKGIQEGFKPPRVGLMIAGLEVPHVHIHVSPIWNLRDLDFANAARDPKSEDLDAAAETLRRALRSLGYPEMSD